MNLLGMIDLIENGRERFYAHIRFQGQEEPGEIQYLLGRWQFRQVAYQGSWVKIKTVEELQKLDIPRLQREMKTVLLTEFCYYELAAEEPNEIRKQSIKHFFGNDVCAAALNDVHEFEKSIVQVIDKMINPRPKLRLVD